MTVLLEPPSPVANRLQGGGGGGGGCTYNWSIVEFSIQVSPSLSPSGSTSFVVVGTTVNLTGTSIVRVTLPDCTTGTHTGRTMWYLYYTPFGGSKTDASSVLSGQSKTTTFNAGLPGIYDAMLLSLESAANLRVSTTHSIIAGSGFTLDGTATIWLTNPLISPKKFDSPINVTLGFLPSTGQLLPVLPPISVDQDVITETSGSGQFDQGTGAMTLGLGLAVTGQIGGTANIALSTDNTISPPIGGPVPGARLGAGNTLTLVGDAPIDGPPGTTHGWLAVSGTLTPISH